MGARVSLLFLAAALVAPISGQVLTSPANSDTHAPVSSIRPTFDAGKTSAAGSESNLMDPLKEAEIRKMMVLTGTEASMDTIFTQMTAMNRQRHPDLPQQFWDDLEQEHKIFHRQLIDRIVAIYAKYYTLDDLKAVNAFYSSPAGQHMLAQKPQILKESLAVGKELGGQMAIRISVKMMDYKQKMSALPPSTNAVPQPTAPASGSAPAAPSKPASEPASPPPPAANAT